ncbi:hypothetical protein Pla123a_39270 [Posidoniimonas polymericola]|uniref:Putative restriction endonuclease domain-containing protein n=1 Tax=Posidoniimonas polymericola TaxID=2528002 RepID=A0A5C5YGD8_9BACT|nr:Uma2 family endonuclease [Posidoniimonas polymericola]TWT73591.1 hypothetical protein Pla123a_39270 [Posidoniimonas polymericola]
MSSLPVDHGQNADWTWEVATLYPQQGNWSESEYLQLTDSVNRFIEFTDGRVEFLAMPTIEHQRIVRFLYDALRAFVDPRQLGEVLFAVLRVYIREGKYREPDIAFKFAANAAESGERYYRGADLVVEVVSDDQESRKRDYETKIADYAEGGATEYWIVDPQQHKITVLTLDGDRYFEHRVATDGQAPSKLLDGFSVDVAAVFAAGKLQ